MSYFDLRPVESIVVTDRQRSEINEEKLAELAESIAKNGLINPITIHEDGTLIAGERRYRAHQRLGLTEIPVHVFDSIDELQHHMIELEENIKRHDLSWEDQVRAVERFHQMKTATDPEWSKTSTAEALGVSKSYATNNILVANLLNEGVKEVLEAPKLSTAVSAARRIIERRQADQIDGLMLDAPEVLTESAPKQAPVLVQPDRTPDSIPTEPVKTIPKPELYHRNFFDFADEVQTVPFNLIHCDFPYGIGTGDKIGQSAAKKFGKYDDGEDVYFDLLSAFLEKQDNFCAPSAHLMFWFSMKYYQETLMRLEEAGWRVNYMPMIWHRSDNSGILPDANRGPRYIYETCLLASRGDRKIVKAVSNVFSSPATKEHHTSEKPLPMLCHYFKMLVGPTTRLLDPTAGSGMALKAAMNMGAERAVGLEKEEGLFLNAKQNLEL